MKQKYLALILAVILLFATNGPILADAFATEDTEPEISESAEQPSPADENNSPVVASTAEAVIAPVSELFTAFEPEAEPAPEQKESADAEAPDEPANPEESPETQEPANPEESPETQEPANPEEPTETQEPANPEESLETQEPANMEEPSESQEPADMEEPDETQEPANTEEPIETPEPTDIPTAISAELTAVSLYGYVNSEAVSVLLRLDGGAAPYTVNIQSYEQDELVEEANDVVFTAGESSYSHMPGQYGVCVMKVIVTDAAGQTWESSVSVPVAAPDRDNGREFLKRAAKVQLTGDWAEDLLAVAASQIGYRESEIDFIIDEDGKTQGYTIYGDWYGAEYSEWCAMFVSWSLNQAGIAKRDFPQKGGCQKLLKEVRQLGIYEGSAEGYEPKPGDVVFFNWDEKSDADHVGIVEKVRDDEIETIEGNSGKEVRRNRYARDDGHIMGYASMEKAMIRAGVLEMPVLEPEATLEPVDDSEFEDPLESVYNCGLEEHAHGETCYDEVGTLTCGLEEHVHTEECVAVELTAEEQAQVEEVIALIDALPTQAEMDEALVALEDAGDEDGYDAYLMEIVTQAKAAYEAYSLLTEAQQAKVSNADRLMALEALWSAVTLEPTQLTDDSAYVSEISISKYTTGTAPWDGDDAPGNDQSADNRVVRTFDEITYNFKAKYLTYDTGITFDDARVKLEFVLPVTADQAEFKQSAMGWMEEPVLTTETRTINGVETECQVLTCYKHLLPSDGHTSVVPGEFGENVTVNVKMMKNGDTLSPIFSAAMEYNTWDGECAQEGHGTEKKSVVAEDIKISAAPKYNVQLKTAFATEARMTFDFSSGAENALNHDAGQVPGRIYTIGITLQLYNDSQDKGMRGVELPQGPITFDIKLSSEFRPNYSTTTTTIPGTPTDVTADYTPLVWSFDEQSKAWNWDRDTSMTSYSYAFGSQTPLNRPDDRSDARDYSCYDGGKWSAVQNGDTVTFTVTDYKFDGIFPCVGVDASLDSATYYNKETGLRNIGCFSAAELYIVQPFQSNTTGKNVLDDFSTGGAHAQSHGNGSCLDGTFNLVVKDVNLRAASVSGQKLSTASDGNTNQGGSNPAAKQDDSLTYTVAMKRPGGYEQRNLYSAKNSAGMNDIFGVNETKAGTCAQNGNDWAVIGTEFGLTFGGYAKTNGEDANKMCAAKWLLKFDPEAIELIEGHRESPEVSNYDFKYLYAVKPDGTGWASDAEMKQTAMVALNYYATIAEAQNHGQIVGVMVEAMPKTTVEALPGGIVLTYFCQNARVKSDLSLANRRFIITEESMVWTVDDFEAAHGQIPTLLGNNPASPTALPQQSYYLNNPSVYGNGDGVYDKHTGGYTQGDTLLVLTYKASIYKKLEQMEANSTEAKYTYNLDSDQRVADFVLDPSVDYGGLKPEVKQTTTVTIVDTLPKYLTYRAGSCYFGGTYAQTSTNGGTQGKVTGGTLHEPDHIVNNADGTQTLTWVISDVVIGEKMDLIHYSVNLGTKGQAATDVPEGTTEVKNVVEISAVGDDRLHSAVNGNYAEAGLQMTRGTASAYGKYSKQNVVEVDGKIDYVIYYDNNAVTEAKDLVLVDAMPVSDVLDSNFTGTWKITSFKISLKGTTTLSDIGASLHYTMESEYAGKTLKDLQDSQVDPIGTWTEATIGTDGTVPALVGKTPVMWVLNGERLPGNSELRVEYTIQLIPEAGSTLDNIKYVNQFSTSNTTTTTETPVVRRTLEGLTWLDDNGDGIQNEAASRRISGVKVELLKLKDGGDPAKESDYEPYCYPGTDTPIAIETGKQISVRASSVDAATDYEQGRYKFTDLPAGTFAVRFTDGSKAISPLLASPENCGTNDAMDSDGIATYSGSNRSRLEQTVILGVDMPKAEDMQVKLFESRNHDSGFYARGFELPATGGHGARWYELGGLALMACALIHFATRRRREGN